MGFSVKLPIKFFEHYTDSIQDGADVIWVSVLANTAGTANATQHGGTIYRIDFVQNQAKVTEVMTNLPEGAGKFWVSTNGQLVHQAASADGVMHFTSPIPGWTPLTRP